MKTIMPKEADVEKKWYLIDAEGLVLGRLASQVASILRGKNKPTYTPNTDLGDYVIVINTDKIVLTGNKLKDKTHFHHTGYQGNQKVVAYDKLMAEHSDRALKYAVK
ncbi:MAG: 50S ribosomal protein L13, partial [Christensenellales bacterium]